MRRAIDMLRASADRDTVTDPLPTSVIIGDLASARSDEILTESERSRSPTAISRQAVRADLARMMRTYGVKTGELALYQDELVDAEYACALCRQVGRCRAWSANECRGAAPRLFCVNALFFEEVTPDPFWSETAPGIWHTDTRTSPLLRLLASEGVTLTEAPPKLGVRKLEKFIDTASKIDALTDYWSRRLGTEDQAHTAVGLGAELDAAIDEVFASPEGIEKGDFCHIFQVAMCDSRLAKWLCCLHDRSQ